MMKKSAKMTVFTLTEPLVRNRYWSNQYLEGIRQEVQRIKGNYRELTFSTLHEVINESAERQLRPTVIVNCISNSWIPGCLDALDKLSIHPLFLAPVDLIRASTASSISFDFFHVFFSLCGYLEEKGYHDIALLGVNPVSSNDRVKEDAFRQFLGKTSCPASHIYANTGSLEECCAAFYQHIGRYQAVICSNDIVAIKLIQFLKHRLISVPRDICVATMGNTYISKLIMPNIIVADFDCAMIGRQAVKLYHLLAKNPEIASLHATASGVIIDKGTTEGLAVTPKIFPVVQSNDYVDFYADQDVQSIFQMESLIKSMDELDWHILRGLLRNEKYADIAQEAFTSESTVKYRIRRLLSRTQCNTKEEAIDLLRQFVDF